MAHLPPVLVRGPSLGPDARDRLLEARIDDVRRQDQAPQPQAFQNGCAYIAGEAILAQDRLDVGETITKIHLGRGRGEASGPGQVPRLCAGQQ
ncbi:hypothetical protein D3C71_1483330 [compost metagenome]